MIKAILACDDKFGIARAGVMPWPANLEDLKHFKQTTLGATVVMGRATWEAQDMPSPLPGRTNVVVTRDSGYNAPGAIVVSADVEESIRNLAAHDTVFVIGGAHLLDEVLPIIDEIILTRIDGDWDCDRRISNTVVNCFEVAEHRRLGNGTRIEIRRRV